MNLIRLNQIIELITYIILIVSMCWMIHSTYTTNEKLTSYYQKLELIINNEYE